MSEDSQSSPLDQPNMLKFVESGMRLTYEFESIGRIEASLGQTIEFHPVISCRGWLNGKELIAALRWKHFASEGREIGRCLLDQDEVKAWGQLLRPMRERDPCSGLRVTCFEYVSRHGIKLFWKSDPDSNNAPFLVFVASAQAAILPSDFISRLLIIFDDFEAHRRRFE